MLRRLYFSQRLFSLTCITSCFISECRLTAGDFPPNRTCCLQSERELVIITAPLPVRSRVGKEWFFHSGWTAGLIDPKHGPWVVHDNFSYPKWTFDEGNGSGRLVQCAPLHARFDWHLGSLVSCCCDARQGGLNSPQLRLRFGVFSALVNL